MGRRTSRKRRLGRTLLVGTLIIGLIGGTVAFINYDFLRAQYLKFTTLDFVGPGEGEVVVRINEGDDGLVITEKLFEAGVVRDIDSFYRYVLEVDPVFYPGSFLLKLQMSNELALEAITNPANAMTYKITIPEGYRAVQIFEEISKVSGIPKSELLETAKDLGSFGISNEAQTIEGYLFPATYSFDTQATAFEILKSMVDRMNQELERFGVSEADRHRVLTFASIVQREAKLPDDFYKVARVYTNRLEIDMILQADPTISYSYDGTDMSDSSKQDAIDFGYNTYLVKGLPPGPISSPGSRAIDATLNPSDGNWLYFVTIDLRSGETKFSKTLKQHEKYVLLLRQWERDNPGWYDD